MADAPVYRYDEGDLLEHRNTYFYSAFHGRPFLDAWAARRSLAAMDAAEAAGPPEEAAAGGAQTDAWIEELRAAFASDTVREDQRRLLANLIQRFEVSKRLHGDYSAEFRPVDPADYRNPRRYLAFAEMLVAAYGADRKLQQLNALLKCMDTLCALHHGLSPASAARLAGLVQAERAFIVELSQRLGVPWPPR